MEDNWIDISGLKAGSFDKLSKYLKGDFHIERRGDTVYLVPDDAAMRVRSADEVELW